MTHVFKNLKKITFTVSRRFFLDYLPHPPRFSNSRLDAHATRDAVSLLPRFQVGAPHLIRDPLHVARSSRRNGNRILRPRLRHTHFDRRYVNQRTTTKKGRCARGTLAANHLWPRLETPLRRGGWGTPRGYIKLMRYSELCALTLL